MHTCKYTDNKLPYSATLWLLHLMVITLQNQLDVEAQIVSQLQVHEKTKG